MTERTWTQVGAGITAGNEERIGSIIERMQWRGLPSEMSLTAGMGISAAIEQLGLGGVTAVADSNEMAPFGLYGIQNTYTDGTARVYVVDRGDDMVVIASDFTPRLAAEGAASASGARSRGRRARPRGACSLRCTCVKNFRTYEVELRGVADGGGTQTIRVGGTSVAQVTESVRTDIRGGGISGSLGRVRVDRTKEPQAVVLCPACTLRKGVEDEARRAADETRLPQTVFATGDADGPLEHRACGFERDGWEPLVTVLPSNYFS